MKIAIEYTYKEGAL